MLGLQAHSQPDFSGKPEGPFCLSCTFIFRNERNWMKKSARVSEKLVSPGLRVATRLGLGKVNRFRRGFHALPLYHQPLVNYEIKKIKNIHMAESIRASQIKFPTQGHIAVTNSGVLHGQTLLPLHH